MMSPDILDTIVTTIITGVVGGGVSALAVIPAMRAELRALREDVDRHEDRIHSISGKLVDLTRGHTVVHSQRQRGRPL